MKRRTESAEIRNQDGASARKKPHHPPQQTPMLMPAKSRIFQEKCAHFTYKICDFMEQNPNASRRAAKPCGSMRTNTSTNFLKKFSNNRPMVQRPFAKTFQGLGPNVPRFGAQPWEDFYELTREQVGKGTRLLTLRPLEIWNQKSEMAESLLEGGCESSGELPGRTKESRQREECMMHSGHWRDKGYACVSMSQLAVGTQHVQDFMLVHLFHLVAGRA